MQAILSIFGHGHQVTKRGQDATPKSLKQFRPDVEVNVEIPDSGTCFNILCHIIFVPAAILAIVFVVITFWKSWMNI